MAFSHRALCVQKRHQTHLGEGQGKASWKNDLVLQDEAQGKIRVFIIQLWTGETEQAKAWRLSVSWFTHVATTWGTATGNEAREGVRTPLWGAPHARLRSWVLMPREPCKVWSRGKTLNLCIPGGERWSLSEGHLDNNSNINNNSNSNNNDNSNSLYRSYSVPGTTLSVIYD